MHPGAIATRHPGSIRNSPTIPACDGLGPAEWGEDFLAQHPRLRRGDALKLLAGDVSAGVVGVLLRARPRHTNSDDRGAQGLGPYERVGPPACGAARDDRWLTALTSASEDQPR